jgi:peptidyl-prolyl cis-trans isomerase A (cyclophilin A)
MKTLFALVAAAAVLSGCDDPPAPKKPVAKAPPRVEKPEPKPEPKPVEAPPKPVEPPAPTVPGPDDAAVKKTAPGEFKVKFTTSRGDFVVRVVRDWSPNGADRFYNLVNCGFFDDARFFRVVAGFMVQFGINGDPRVSAKWRDATVQDDPVKESNARGKLSFAMRGPNTRTTQIFINFGDNSRLDGSGFSPFAEVVEGMSVVDSLNAEYGEGAPRGSGPDQGRVQKEGNEFLNKDFPKLDYVKTARVVE